MQTSGSRNSNLVENENAGRPTEGPAGCTVCKNGFSDRVDVISMAKFLEKLSKLPPVRREKILRAKKLIENGEYETREKLDTAVERLVKELEG